MSGSVTGLVTHSYHDSLWWELGRGARGGGRVGGGITRALTGPPWRGVQFCEIVDLVDCICSPPCNPLCGYPVQSKTLRWKASPPLRRRGQRPAQRARFVWVLSLTTRAAPHLNLMDPTYAVITMPTGCQPRCWRGLCASERCNCVALICLSLTTSRHLKGATKVNASLLLRDHLIRRWKKQPLTPYCKDWIH